MANWYGLSRTNYFRVKDAEAFKAGLANYAGITIVEHEGAFALIDNTDEGWPACVIDENGDLVEADGNVLEFSIDDYIVEHLTEDDIAVVVTAGHEKARYATGCAYALNSRGESVYVGIDSIYALAKERFGITPTEAAY